MDVVNQFIEFSEEEPIEKPKPSQNLYITSQVRHREKWIKLKDKYSILSTWIEKSSLNDYQKEAPINRIREKMVKEIEACEKFILYLEDAEDLLLKGIHFEFCQAMMLHKPIYIVYQNVKASEVIDSIQNYIRYPNIILVKSFKQLKSKILR